MDGLINGTVYEFRVTPYSASGVGASSLSVPVTGSTFQPATLPSTPLLTTTPLSATSIQLNWKLVSDGGSAITKWVIYRYTPNVTVTLATITTNAASTFQYTDSGIPVGTAYYQYRIVPTNAIGDGATSAWSYAYPVGVFDPPSNISATPGDAQDRKSTRLNSSHIPLSRMPSSA